jgi:hypothetical protein
MKQEWREPVAAAPLTLWPGRPVTFEVSPKPAAFPVRQWLRLIGELDIGWQWRHEAGSAASWMYRVIDDALWPGEAIGRRFCMLLEGLGEAWPRNAFARVFSPVLAAPGRAGQITMSVMVKAKLLTIDGEAVMEAGIYRRTPERRDDDFSQAPDAVVQVPIPPGSYDWQRIQTTFELPADTVGVVVRIGGHGFHGKAWIGDACFAEAGSDNLLPALDRANPTRPRWNWVGENLSQKEWISLSLSIDGATAWQGRFFHPFYRWPEIEIPLPALLSSGSHRFELTLLPTMAEPLPLIVRDVHLLRESARPVEVLGYPEFPRSNEMLAVLLELNDGGRTELQVEKIDAGPARASPEYTLTSGVTIRPRRVVEIDVAGPWLCAGDLYHFPHTAKAFSRFLGWYARHNLGNAFCLRSAYQWNGERDTSPEPWRAIVPLLQELGWPYHLVNDGRQLNEANRLNPPAEWLAGPGYEGSQNNELDTISYGFKPRQESGLLYWDLHYRRRRATGVACPPRYAWRDANSVDIYDRYVATDMAAAHAQFVKHQADHRGNATRHSGPSTLQRYFIEAGYSFVATEMMYGTSEVLLSATRGATRAAGGKHFGTHIATQWSSTPHDRPDRAVRQFLALATVFIQGADDLTSEDGMWRIEFRYADHDRFSRACRMHRGAQQRFGRFIATHPRRGQVRVPLAVLLGRHCGWDGWNRDRVWGSLRPEFAFADPERSFDLLTTLFPRYVGHGLYKYDCPKAPQGWFSGTPYGPVDLLPIDAPADVLSRYRGAIVLGWNTADVEQAKRLRGYIERGGNLLLAQPHLSTSVRRDPLPAAADPKVLQALLGVEELPGVLWFTAHHGEGSAMVSALPVYPIHTSVKDSYAEAIRHLVAGVVAKEFARGWVTANENVTFAAWDWGDHRTIYLLSIDWWSDATSHEVTLHLGEATHRVAVRRGRVEVITIAHGMAVWAMEGSMDLMQVTSETARVQSDRGGRLVVLGEDGRRRDVIVSEGGVHDVAICTQ